MRSNVGMTLTALVVLSALPACADRRKASALDRQTALLLLQEAGARIFEGQEAVYDAKTRELVAHDASGWDQKRGEMTIEFLDILARVGVVSQKNVTEVAAGHDALGMAFPAHALYSYSFVPQENIRRMYPNTFNEVLLIKVGKLAAKEILGIRQEGTEATVDVSLSTTPTPLYEKITAAGRSLFAQCGAFPDPKPYFCVRWPSREKLGEIDKGTFHFVRYDDGWRLVNE